MNDKILVRLIDINDEQYITSYETTNWSEAFKLYYFLKEKAENIALTIAQRDDGKYNGSEFYIQDISVQFGDKIGLNTIDIFVEVI